jgi:hypothetical protein
LNPPEGGPRSGGFWPEWLTPKRFADFAVKIVRLTKSVDDLTRKNKELEAAVAELQRNQVAQSKEINILVRFVESAIHEGIEVKAENAAYRILSVMQRSQKPEDEKS